MISVRSATVGLLGKSLPSALAKAALRMSLAMRWSSLRTPDSLV